MSKYEVIPVASRRDRQRFLHLPWQLYHGDVNWIPSLRHNQKELVGYAKHPFYDQAEGQTFLAMKDGRPSGRVLALVNNAHNRRYRAKDGFFGFFESIDDGEVAGGLFAAAKQWVAERGMTLVPLRLYLRGGYAKVELGVGRGKKRYDKRRAIIEREREREARAAIRTR